VTLLHCIDNLPPYQFARDTFSYVDAGQASTAGFATHLHAYQPLFLQLNGCRFLYIANCPANFASAARCFSERVLPAFAGDISGEILRYFRLRNAWEVKRYGLFSNDEIEWLNEATRRFHGDKFETLYSAWSSGQMTGDAVRSEFTQTLPHRKAEFATYLVGENQFAMKT